MVDKKLNKLMFEFLTEQKQILKNLAKVCDELEGFELPEALRSLIEQL